MSIWFWILSFILGFFLGYITAAIMCRASIADETIERAVSEERRKRKEDETRPMVEIVDDFTIRPT